MAIERQKGNSGKTLCSGSMKGRRKRSCPHKTGHPRAMWIKNKQTLRTQLKFRKLCVTVQRHGAMSHSSWTFSGYHI